MIFSVGKSISRSRPLLAKDGPDQNQLTAAPDFRFATEVAGGLVESIARRS
jgi:hypothetical protein